MAEDVTRRLSRGRVWKNRACEEKWAAQATRQGHEGVSRNAVMQAVSAAEERRSFDR
jgi:hypothetical protein